jgi:precorrin-2/cobalt-factor-2 C20-methyltransferase
MTELSSCGTLYGIGVGPGDPELLTLKAARLLRQTRLIAVPITQAEGNSYALTVAAQHLHPEHTLLRLHFPMVRDAVVRAGHRQAAAKAITEQVCAGRDVAFLTEGDPLLHSTFIYILNYLPPELPVEVIPGVSSITAAAAQARLPLVNADQRLAILPATFEDMAELRRILGEFDAVVLLKVQRVLDQVLDVLAELQLTEQAVLVERASHPASRVIRGVARLRGTAVHYLSLLIIHPRRGDRED